MLSSGKKLNTVALEEGGGYWLESIKLWKSIKFELCLDSSVLLQKNKIWGPISTNDTDLCPPTQR